VTDNSENPNRPNANYKLSRQNIDPLEEENLNFYYNRQRRLDKAPQSVRDLYEKPRPKFSLIRPLVGDKPRAVVFFTIIILCVLILVLSRLGYMDSSYSLDGNILEISAAIFEDATIINLKKTVNSKEPYTGAVDIGVSPVTTDEDFPVFLHRAYFTLREEEEFSFVVPYNSPKLIMVLNTEKYSLNITISSN
jgi:hypothetical protein